jgi:hypothetical protein
MIDLSAAYIAIVPAIVAFIAGIIRQDRLPPLINDAITLVVVLILATIQALLGGKLGGSPLADFVLVASYATALARTPLLASLQEYLQSHVLSFGKPATATTQPSAAPTGTVPPIIHIDVPSLAQQLLGQLNLQQLAALLRDELIKASQTQQLRSDQQATKPMPVAPVPAAPVRANTPQGQTWQGPGGAG